jgi:hypothetical protein
LGPMDFSAFEMDDVEDLPSLSTAPNTSPGKQRPLPNDQYSGFLLGHNNLKSIKSLPKVAEQLLVNPPEQVQWLVRHNPSNPLTRVPCFHPLVCPDSTYSCALIPPLVCPDSTYSCALIPPSRVP